jgi:hypothetical protein
MDPNIPIPTLHLFPQIDELLIELLQSLSPEDWQRQTLAPAWKVKDVAAHLLDGNIRSLSTSRDNFFPETSIRTEDYHEVVQYLNILNGDWVNALKRVSPQMLITLLSVTNKLYSDHLGELPPFAKAIFPVAWAGEAESQNWFHIAREYTEKWHHQQQIRQAVGVLSPLFHREYFKPYLDTSLRALPYRLSRIIAEPGDTFSLIVSGEGGGEWHYTYLTEGWVQSLEPPSYSVTKVIMDDQVIWRMFSKEISTEELYNRTMITGNRSYAETFLGMTAVMV